MSGLFISLEGLEGCGKTTIAKYLIQWLNNLGQTTHHMREPGGTPVGEDIRNMLLTIRTEKEHDLVPSAELLLFMAGRLQNLERVVKPKLAAGHVIVSERFMDSTYALQGFGRGLLKEIESIDKIYNLKDIPDVTFLLKISVEESNKRQGLQGREQDRFEIAGDSFHSRVAEGFDYCVQNDERGRIVIIDAEQPLDKVIDDICKNLYTLMVTKNLIPKVQDVTGTNSLSA